MQLTRKWLDKTLSRCHKEGDCLIWDGYKKNGYATTTLNKKHVSLHRLIYIYHNGPIPDGLEIDHVRARGCHSRACLNIEHMEAVTQGINVLRGDAVSGLNSRKTHCPKGHPLNITISSRERQWRDCSICRFLRWRKFRRAKENTA